MFYFLERLMNWFRGKNTDDVYEQYLLRQREYYKHLNDDSWKKNTKTKSLIDYAISHSMAATI